MSAPFEGRIWGRRAAVDQPLQRLFCSFRLPILANLHTLGLPGERGFVPNETMLLHDVIAMRQQRVFGIGGA